MHTFEKELRDVFENKGQLRCMLGRRCLKATRIVPLLLEAEHSIM